MYGLAAVVSGFVLIAGYVVLQEGDLPYEDEIVDVIASQTPEQTAQTAKDVTEAAVGSVDGCDDSEREA